MHERYVHNKLGLGDVVAQGDGRLTLGRFMNLPNLTSNASLVPSACFVGPRAENIAAMERLAQAALKHIADYRREFHPDDPNISHSEGHDQSLKDLEWRFGELLEYLGTHATPFSSMRYQAHMLSDILLPAWAGYFVGMMHNSNNVTIQASTDTTLLEMMVMRDLCQMVGLDFHRDSGAPWAHITVDGSVANMEGVWSAREAKYVAIAAREVFADVADQIAVRLCDGRQTTLGGATDWELLNLTRSQRLRIPGQIAARKGLQEATVWDRIVQANLNARGWAHFLKVNNGSPWPAVYVPSTAHYSWAKAAAVLGMDSTGSVDGAGLTHIPVDANARVDLAELEKALTGALNGHIPVLVVMSVFGSTEEGAVDDLAGILDMRERFRAKGLDFDVHVDAAWGGYLVSTIRESFRIDEPPSAPTLAVAARCESTFVGPEMRARVPLNDHVVNQAMHIRMADSATIDAHKMGYVQYPNGAVLYRDGDVRNLTTFTGSYIGSASDPTVGLFGIEGSRPGAAATALYFAHFCLRPDYLGYGEVINRSIYNAKQLYCHLNYLKGDGRAHFWKAFTLTPLPYSDDVITAKILDRPLDEIRKDPEAMAILREIGQDQNIVDFGINFAVGSGNTSVDLYNEYTSRLYQALSITYDDLGETTKPLRDMNFMVSMTTFTTADYGQRFVRAFAKQLCLTAPPEGQAFKLNCLRSTVMGPFVSDTEVGTYWPRLMDVLADVIAKVDPPSPQA